MDSIHGPQRPWWRSPLLYGVAAPLLLLLGLAGYFFTTVGRNALAAARTEAVDLGILVTVADLTPAPMATEANAAVAYRRIASAFTASPGSTDLHPDLKEAITAKVRSAETLALLDQGNRAAAWAELIDASRLPGCDFGWDLSQGPNLHLPELSPWRDLGKLLVLRIHNLTAAGRGAEAADLLAAGLRMRRHLDGTPLLIVALVADSVEAGLIAGLREEIAVGSLPDAGLATIRAALEAPPARDSLMVAVRGEIACLAGWCFADPAAAGTVGGGAVPGYGSWFLAPMRRHDEAVYLQHMIVFARRLQGESPPPAPALAWHTPLAGLLVPATDMLIASADDQELLRLTARTAVALALGESPGLVPDLSVATEAGGSRILTPRPPSGKRKTREAWEPWRIPPR